MKNQLTKDGFQQLSQELKKLTQRADNLIIKIEEVAQPDESGEDSLASQLKAELEVVNSKIIAIEEVLESTGSSNKVDVTIEQTAALEKLYPSQLKKMALEKDHKGADFSKVALINFLKTN